MIYIDRLFSALLMAALCLQVMAQSTIDAGPHNVPLIHAVANDDIQSIMQRLNKLIYEKDLGQTEIAEKRRQYMEELTRASADMVKAAANITDAIPGIRMDQESQLTFEALARQLQSEAGKIRKFAEEFRYMETEPAFQRMQDTCNACHRLFRY